jgi:gephyrin
MLQVEEALAAVLSAAASARAAPRGVPLHDALGLVLAEEVRAPDPLPPFRASIKVGSVARSPAPFRHPPSLLLSAAAPWRGHVLML